MKDWWMPCHLAHTPHRQWSTWPIQGTGGANVLFSFFLIKSWAAFPVYHVSLAHWWCRFLSLTLCFHSGKVSALFSGVGELLTEPLSLASWQFPPLCPSHFHQKAKTMASPWATLKGAWHQMYSPLLQRAFVATSRKNQTCCFCILGQLSLTFQG